MVAGCKEGGKRRDGNGWFWGECTGKGGGEGEGSRGWGLALLTEITFVP